MKNEKYHNPWITRIFPGDLVKVKPGNNKRLERKILFVDNIEDSIADCFWLDLEWQGNHSKIDVELLDLYNPEPGCP